MTNHSVVGKLCKKTSFLILMLQLISAQKVIDHSTSEKPIWTIEPPTGKYYLYYTGVGSSPNSLSGAKEQAIANVLSEIIMEGKITADSRIHTFHEQSNQGIVSEVSREIQQTGAATSIEGLRKEEEYWQTVKTQSGILYQYWILMKIPKPEFAGLDLSIKQGYGITPVLKSVIVPGWGQFHKGESKKGWRFLITETVFVSSFFISNYFSINYSIKAENERDYDRRKFYNDWSNRSYTIGTVSGILASAIYVYNIFDSITSKGTKKYAHLQTRPLEIFANVNYNQAELIIFISL